MLISAFALGAEVLALHSNQLTGTITQNICVRRDPDLAWSRLEKLTADCTYVSCDCCTCYEDGAVVSTFLPPTPLNATPPPIPAPVATSPPTEIIVSRPTSPPLQLADRDTMLIKEKIENTVLQRNASFDNMEEDDHRYLALDWIVNIDQRKLTAEDVNLSQRYVLALIAFSLDSLAWYYCGDHRKYGNFTEEFAEEDCEVINLGTGQVEYHNVWLSSADECDWYGSICSQDGFVRGLELSE